MKLILTREADLDLTVIYEQSARQFGLGQADRYGEGLRQALYALLDFPYQAPERFAFDPPVRVKPYRSHLILYRVQDGDVVVLRVRHGREDWLSADPE